VSRAPRGVRILRQRSKSVLPSGAMMARRSPLSFLVLLAFARALPACQGGDKTASSASSTMGAATGSAAGSGAAAVSAPSAAGASAPVASVGGMAAGGVAIGVPLPAASVLKVVNPNGEPPSTRPSGTIKGTVRIEGAPPPETPQKIPAKCGEAAATYGRLFRVGLDKALGDVLVAVTGYEGFVPEREPSAKITIHGCALSKRTMAVTFGQNVAVANLDTLDPYMPYLDGAPTKAALVAVPNGDPVKLYPLAPGHYLLRDELNDFMRAEVFVVAFATHDVTGLDGQYAIKNIPAGQVKVSAFLPALGAPIEKLVEVKPGETTIDFTFTYPAKGEASASPMAKPVAGKARAGE